VLGPLSRDGVKARRVKAESGPIRASAALVSSLRGGSLASERALDRSEYGEYSASLWEKSFEIPIRCNHPNPLLGRRLRLESVPNAMEQGKVAAANLCGKERTYAESP